MYPVFRDLKRKAICDIFINILNSSDQFISFNWDIVLEKRLWDINLWSPLDGYIGINEFYSEGVKLKLREHLKYSSNFSTEIFSPFSICALQN